MSEGIDVEFKESVGGVDSTDLVAFANSPEGGAILIGVHETKDENGLQRGEPVGIAIGDDSKLKIINKAMSCVPPVHVEVFAENLSDKPFYRLEVPPGPLKPYCSSGGTYKLRVDGRIRPLHPEALLDLFLQREGTKFRERFAEATQQIVADLRSTLGSIEEIKGVVDQKLEGIGSTLEWAEFKVDDTASTIEKVEDNTNRIEVEIDALRERLTALLIHHEIPDPIKEAARKKLSAEIEQKLRNDSKLRKKILESGSFSITNANLRFFNKEEVNQIMIDVLKKIAKEGT